MTSKDITRILATLVFGFFLGFFFGSAQGNSIDPHAELFSVKRDTITIVEQCPEILVGKKALIIGDSHSAYSYGWQFFLSKWTGLTIKNTAVEGRTTAWMKERLIKNIDTSYSYCFIFGGGNDAAAGISPYTILKNVQQMVDACNSLGVKPVVITGSSPEVVMSPSRKWEKYSSIKSDFQTLLARELRGAVLIDIRKTITKSDCADFICHMQVSGHKKIANKIIEDMDFQRL